MTAYLLHRAGGFDLLIVLKAAAVLLWSVCAWLLAWRTGYRSPLVAGVILLGLWSGCDRFIERCSLVSDILTAVVATVLCLERRAPTRSTATSIRVFDPFRIDRFNAALQHEPQRAWDETVRVLPESPQCKTARHVLGTTFQEDPDEVLARDRAAAAVAR